MQASINALKEKNTSDDSIAGSIARALYGPLQEKSGRNWVTVAQALTTRQPSSLPVKKWQILRRMVDKFEQASAPSIAEAIADVALTKKQPAGIITFNAEPLLFALINAAIAVRGDDKKDVIIMDRMAHNLATRHRDRIPYYYAHGLVRVPNGKDQFNDSLSPGKLVFTEAQYLQPFPQRLLLAGGNISFRVHQSPLRIRWLVLH